MIRELKRILLVEDDPRDVELTMEALGGNNLGNDVDVVGDGEKALDYLFKRGEFAARSGENPAVILLDLKLPKIDGKEVLKEIRSHDALKMIPVVVLTTTDNPQEIARCYELGCNVYIAKPVEYEQFSDAIRKLGLFLSIVRVPE